MPGLREVLHARFTDHAYPLHTHDTWTVLLIDTGAVAYDLDRGEHGAVRQQVTVLPPHVPHNGRSATDEGFRKRVLYLDSEQLTDRLVGRAADHPEIADPDLRSELDLLHRVLPQPGDEFEAESRLALIRERLEDHLLRIEPAAAGRDRTLAVRLRELIDSRIESGLRLDEAAGVLQAHPTHLVRTFSREFGLPPHRYLTGRRLDRARGLLLAGQPAAEVATAVGFHDQSHLTRQFRRLLGVPPGAYASRPAGPEFPGVNGP